MTSAIAEHGAATTMETTASRRFHRSNFPRADRRPKAPAVKPLSFFGRILSLRPMSSGILNRLHVKSAPFCAEMEDLKCLI
jgi:hypothetical protein